MAPNDQTQQHAPDPHANSQEPIPSSTLSKATTETAASHPETTPEPSADAPVKKRPFSTVWKHLDAVELLMHGTHLPPAPSNLISHPNNDVKQVRQEPFTNATPNPLPASSNDNDNDPIVTSIPSSSASSASASNQGTSSSSTPIPPATRKGSVKSVGSVGSFLRKHSLPRRTESTKSKEMVPAASVAVAAEDDSLAGAGAALQPKTKMGAFGGVVGSLTGFFKKDAGAAPTTSSAVPASVTESVVEKAVEEAKMDITDEPTALAADTTLTESMPVPAATTVADMEQSTNSPKEEAIVVAASKTETKAADFQAVEAAIPAVSPNVPEAAIVTESTASSVSEPSLSDSDSDIKSLHIAMAVNTSKASFYSEMSEEKAGSVEGEAWIIGPNQVCPLPGQEDMEDMKLPSPVVAVSDDDEEGKPAVSLFANDSSFGTSSDAQVDDVRAVAVAILENVPQPPHVQVQQKLEPVASVPTQERSVPEAVTATISASHPVDTPTAPALSVAPTPTPASTPTSTPAPAPPRSNRFKRIPLLNLRTSTKHSAQQQQQQQQQPSPVIQEKPVQIVNLSFPPTPTPLSPLPDSPRAYIQYEPVQIDPAPSMPTPTINSNPPNSHNNNTSTRSRYLEKRKSAPKIMWTLPNLGTIDLPLKTLRRYRDENGKRNSEARGFERKSFLSGIVGRRSIEGVGESALSKVLFDDLQEGGERELDGEDIGEESPVLVEKSVGFMDEGEEEKNRVEVEEEPLPEKKTRRFSLPWKFRMNPFRALELAHGDKFGSLGRRRRSRAKSPAQGGEEQPGADTPAGRLLGGFRKWQTRSNESLGKEGEEVDGEVKVKGGKSRKRDSNNTVEERGKRFLWLKSKREVEVPAVVSDAKVVTFAAGDSGDVSRSPVVREVAVAALDVSESDGGVVSVAVPEKLSVAAPSPVSNMKDEGRKEMRVSPTHTTISSATTAVPASPNTVVAKLEKALEAVPARTSGTSSGDGHHATDGDITTDGGGSSKTSVETDGGLHAGVVGSVTPKMQDVNCAAIDSEVTPGSMMPVSSFPNSAPMTPVMPHNMPPEAFMQFQQQMMYYAQQQQQHQQHQQQNFQNSPHLSTSFPQSRYTVNSSSTSSLTSLTTGTLHSMADDASLRSIHSATRRESTPSISEISIVSASQGSIRRTTSVSSMGGQSGYLRRADGKDGPMPSPNGPRPCPNSVQPEKRRVKKRRKAVRDQAGMILPTVVEGAAGGVGGLVVEGQGGVFPIGPVVANPDAIEIVGGGVARVIPEAIVPVAAIRRVSDPVLTSVGAASVTEEEGDDEADGEPSGTSDGDAGSPTSPNGNSNSTGRFGFMRHHHPLNGANEAMPKVLVNQGPLLGGRRGLLRNKASSPLAVAQPLRSSMESG
ncbi:hypothetical protein HDU97_005492 [Phlyctochytrium planicorne]|nr:hypothetical protein HDU97_005492 [Phlyctochytrium planicorne]